MPGNDRRIMMEMRLEALEGPWSGGIARFLGRGALVLGWLCRARRRRGRGVMDGEDVAMEMEGEGVVAGRGVVVDLGVERAAIYVEAVVGGAVGDNAQLALTGLIRGALGLSLRLWVEPRSRSRIIARKGV